MRGQTKKRSLVGCGGTADIFTWGHHQIIKLFHDNWPVVAIEEETRIGPLVGMRLLPLGKGVGPKCSSTSDWRGNEPLCAWFI